MTFIGCKNEDLKCISPPLIPIGSLDIENSFEYGDEIYETNELVVAVKNNCLEKIAVILGKLIFKKKREQSRDKRHYFNRFKNN